MTITVIGVNDVPIAADDNDANIHSTNEDTPLSVSAASGLLSNDIDVDALDVLSVSEVNGSASNVGTQIILASGALLTVNADGSYDYNPNGKFESLAVNESDTDSFTYQASDGHGGFSTATATITVNGVNDAPVAQSGLDSILVSGDEDAVITVTFLSTDVDGFIESFRIDTLPPTPNGILFTDIGLTTPLVEGVPFDAISNTATLYFVPAQDFNGNVLIDYVAIDNDGDESTTSQVNITVDPVNDAPVANDQTYSIAADQPIVSELFLADDVDNDDDQSTLIYVSSIVQGEGILTQLGNQFSYDPSTDYIYLGEGETAIVKIEYTAEDSHGAISNTGVIEVTVTGVNDAPTANNDSYSDGFFIIKSAAEGLLANDSDPDTTDKLSVFEINGNTSLGFNALDNGILVVGTDGSFIYIGNGNPDSFEYTISDGHGGTSTATVTLNALEVAPMILDLNDNNKIELIDPDKSSVTLNSFDDTHGTNQMGWVKPTDGILVYDYQGDGKVSNIDEIALTLHSEQAKTDLDALRIAFDTNHDGVFDAKDEKFEKFGVWQDKNSDGISDEGEYHTLTQMGIISINLSSDHQAQIINGNTVHGFNSYQTADGVSHLMADVSLSVAPATKSVAISTPDVIGDHNAIDFSSILSLPPLASEHAVSLIAASVTAIEGPAEVMVVTADSITQQLQQQHQETHLS